MISHSFSETLFNEVINKYDSFINFTRRFYFLPKSQKSKDNLCKYYSALRGEWGHFIVKARDKP